MARYENLELDDQLCFALCRASRAITRAYRPRLARLGLTYPQYLVLLALWERDNRSVREIAERVDLDSATMTPLLKRLEEQKLLTRTRSSRDQRTVRAKLTARGREMEEAAARVQREIARLTGLSTESFKALRNDLHGLADTLADAGLPHSSVA